MNLVDLYLEVRLREGRMYSDDIVKRLPEVASDHPLASEWSQRAQACARLLAYLRKLPVGSSLLDLGCGNGWLAARLCALPDSRVWAADRNFPELEQARRVFEASNLWFVLGDIAALPYPSNSFDVIILASVIQYFQDLHMLLRDLLSLLKPGGEIHILDSPLYTQEELEPARRRTDAYYEKLGFPEMAMHYFHHPVSSLDGFSAHWLYRPGKWQYRLRRRLGNPIPLFPWVCLSWNG